MYKIICASFLFLSFFGCVSLGTYNEIKDKLIASNKEVEERKNEISSLNAQKTELQNTLNKFGKIKTENSITNEEEEKAKRIYRSNNWYKEDDPEYYKNDLLGGLGKIWVLKTDSAWIEGGAIASKEFETEPNLKDKGSLIFSHYCNKSFNADIDIVKTIKANIGDSSYAKLTYEIIGTSELKITQDNLQKAATKYAKTYTDNKVKGVYLCTGYHVRQLSLVQYNVISANGIANTPIINVNGGFYSEDKTQFNSWEVSRQLVDLSIFFVPAVKDSALKDVVAQLPANKTIYETLISTVPIELSDEEISEFISNPKEISEQNIVNLERTKNVTFSKDQKTRLAYISKYLTMIKNKVGISPAFK